MFDKLKQKFTQAGDFIKKKSPSENLPKTSETKIDPSTHLPDGRPFLITRDEILMGRDKEFPLTPELEKNLLKLLESLNYLRYDYGKPMTVSSGYRPGYYNKNAGGAKSSAHLTCEACDFGDVSGDLDSWCMANQDKLRKYGLRLEHPSYTKNWCHLDIKLKDKVVFIP